MKVCKLICVVIVMVAASWGVVAQQSVNKTPGKYLMPMDNASLAIGNSKVKEGDLWVVFSDRPNNPLFSDKSCTKPNGKKLDFMKPLYVVDETETAIKVVDIEDADLRGILIDGASSRAAWVLKENMLLWKTCLKTRDVNLPEFKDGIFNKKAMVLNIISGTQQVMEAPNYYSHPRCANSDVLNSVLIYQINYVYKETEDAYLLSELPEIVNFERDAGKVKGWVKKSQTTAWNHRLAYEVNWDAAAVAERKSKGFKAKITTGKDGTGSPIFQEKGSYSKRAIGEVDRFPVLDVINGSAKVGVIGDLRSSNGKTLSSEEFAQIKHVIDSMSTSLRNINVIFVIDGTSSMIPYNRAIQTGLKQTMRELLKSNNNFQFGALVYRDAQEGNSKTVSFSRDLSSNYNEIITTLNRYMVAGNNTCNNDEEEAMYYGLSRAIERFDPSVGESNFVFLIGDAGNHNRTSYVDCNGQEKPDFTNIEYDKLLDLMVRKNINLVSYQVNHKIAGDFKPAYDAFRTQVTKLTEDLVKRRAGAGAVLPSTLLKQAAKNSYEVDNSVGISGKILFAPDGGSIHPTVFVQEMGKGLRYIDEQVNKKMENISLYLNGKLKGDDVKQLSSFIKQLESLEISGNNLDIVFEKNGQLYNTGYAMRKQAGLQYPVYQDVLLMSQVDLMAIKKSLERLIPTDERALSPNESRGYILYAWGDILVEILGYFPEFNEELENLSLYTLSAILTGWGGKEKYKDIKLMDVVKPDKFSDEMLSEYLIDWCITKGHIQSIYDGKNLLTGDFFEDHKWTYFFQYLYLLANVDEDPSMKSKFEEFLKKYDKEYNNFQASFRVPVGTGAGLKHYWIDARIFPHSTKEFGEKSLTEVLYGEYIK